MPRIKKQEHKREAPKEKVELVKSLAGLMDKSNTVMFASIKALPAKQFQKIKKGLSVNTEVRVVKKNMLVKAIDQSKKENIKELKNYIKEDIAVLISQFDAFELSAKLAESRVPVKAKVGQEANMDIVVEPGPTELTAGPVVSELGALGLKIEIKAGKIEIKEAKTIVKEGKKITEGACNIMSKLNIMPFSVGFIPIAAYDSSSGKVYSDLVIDKPGMIAKIKELFSKSLAFAVGKAYPSKETIGFILAKASSHENAIASLMNTHENVEESK